jgi:hypothetical protein
VVDSASQYGPGEYGCHLCAQDSFYVTYIKGVGHVFQQTFVDPCSRIVVAKLYNRKNPKVAVDLLSSRVVPFYVDNGIPLARILTDRGREFCGETHDHVYELYLNSENIAHIKTRTANPQGNRICRPIHDTLHQEFYDDALRKQYRQLSTLQADLDKWIAEYNAHGMLSPFKRARAQRKTFAQTIVRAMTST